jgi:hypothetical protein
VTLRRARIPRTGRSPLRRIAGLLIEPSRIPRSGSTPLQRWARAHLTAASGPRKALSLSAAVAVLGSVIVVWPASAGSTIAISQQASPSGFTVGALIFDVATLGGGANPTGTITFTLYGPGDTTCASSIFQSPITVSGNGNYQSGDFTANEAGTYQWVASYGGDDNNPAVSTACGDVAGQVGVGKASPAFSTTASPSVPANGQIFDTATLSAGGGPSGPTGTITFELYGPDNPQCTPPSIFSPTATVAGNGSYASDPYTATLPGTYQWVATYGGDDNNFPRNTPCIDPAESVVVTPGGLVTPTITTAASSSVAVGGDVTDVATLAGGANPTGSIVFTLYGPNDANCATTAFVSPPVTVSGNGTYTSAAFTTTVEGTFRWRAVYGGDGANNPVSTACNDPMETVVVTASTTSTTSTTSTSTTSTTNPTATTTTSTTNPTATTTTSTTNPTATTSSSTTSSTSTSTTSTTNPTGTTSTTRPTATTSSTSTTTTTMAPATTTTTINTPTATTTSTSTTPPGPATLRASQPSGLPGDPIVLTASGFVPREPIVVTFNSTPVVVAQVPAGATGTFSIIVSVPADATAGAHSFVATGSSGRSASVPFTVLTRGTTATTTTLRAATPLARTGSPTRGLLSLAALLFALGSGALLIAARRRKA